MLRKITLYFTFVLLFVVAKLVFMLYHLDLFGIYGISGWMAVIWHGLPHDLTCAGYVMALPFLLELVRIWVKGSWHAAFMRIYLPIVVCLVLALWLVDLVLYGYWGFRIDGTVLFYLLDNPAEALGQAAWWQWLCGLSVLALLTWGVTRLLAPLCDSRVERNVAPSPASLGKKLAFTVEALLLCGMLFVAIRGGVSTSTMNVGRVYFSSEMPLNQAATNPLFSFFSTIGKQKRFDNQYRFMSDDEALQAMSALAATAEADSSALGIAAPEPENLCLLSTRRPNIVLVILEGFSGAASRVLHPEIEGPSYIPNIDRLYAEGIGFTHMYANSFRTDRGVAAILASYPGQPTYSVMKNQQKCNHLQYLSQRLKEQDYSLRFIHGGDVDFTNMRGFLTAGGFSDITGDSDFPIVDRLSKWGVPDHKMFDYLFDEVVADRQSKPFLKVMLTLSSHEPFDVEYHHYDDPYLNSLAYADSCLGSFVDRLKATEVWQDLLLILVPDHCYARYPQTVMNHEMLRYHIPMVWTGGAIAGPQIVGTLGQQTDLAATLLGQMDIAHDDFNFSKDLLDWQTPHYAFYSFSDGFGFLTDSCRYIQDNANNGCALSGSDDPNGTAERWGKAYLQRLYDDLQQR